ncbi:MAG: hypothetical protein U0270_17320 [Labilithrix sp.]
MKRSGWLGLAAAVALVSFACSSHREGLDPTKVPDDLQGDYQTFAQRCSKCHSLARPLSAGIKDDDQWVNYVNRMRRQPGSGISLNDQAHILRFLKWYAAELRRRDAEKTAEQTKAPPPPPAAIPPPVPSYIPEPPPSADGGAP